MNLSAHFWALAAVSATEEKHRARKFRDECMENARISRRLYGVDGPCVTWVRAARLSSAQAVKASLFAKLCLESLK